MGDSAMLIVVGRGRASVSRLQLHNGTSCPESRNAPIFHASVLFASESSYMRDILILGLIFGIRPGTRGLQEKDVSCRPSYNQAC
jgi:hypothetical protein